VLNFRESVGKGKAIMSYVAGQQIWNSPPAHVTSAETFVRYFTRMCAEMLSLH